MEQGGQFIRLTLDVKEPVELGDFVSSFTALSAEYDRFLKSSHPDLASDATLYVKEVRKGSIEADIIPWLLGAAGVGGVVGILSALNTIDEFIERYGGRLQSYLKPGGRADDATKTELKHFSDQVASIANNPGSTIKIAAMERVNGTESIRAVFQFDTIQAQDIQERVSEHKRELDQKDRVDHSRVLMRFTRTDLSTVKPGEPTGERVIIESLDVDSKRVVYASDLVEARFKHEIRDEQDNIYKKIFVVDVNVEMQCGKPWAYRVTAIHAKMDIED